MADRRFKKMIEKNLGMRQTCVNFKIEVIEKADLIVSQRLIPGVTNRSGLIDYALKLVFKELKVEG